MAARALLRKSAGSYVYEIVVDGVVRYIGKGTGDRAWRHISFAEGIIRRRDAGEKIKTQKFYNKLAKAIRANSKVEYRIVMDGIMSNKAAFAAEVSAIASVPVGQLWNVLSGGQGADSEHFKRNWQDPEIREKMLAPYSDPEYIAKKKALAAIQWSDQSARNTNSETLKKQWSDPEFRAARIASIKSKYTEDMRVQARTTTKERWADPDVRARQEAAIRAACSTEDFLRKRSKNSKAMWEDKERSKSHGAAISLGQKNSEKFKSMWKDPVRREKHSQALKLAWAKRKAEQCLI